MGCAQGLDWDQSKLLRLTAARRPCWTSFEREGRWHRALLNRLKIALASSRLGQALIRAVFKGERLRD